MYSAPEAKDAASRFTPLDVNKLVEKILELKDDKQATPEQEKSGNNDSGAGNNETSDDKQKPPSP